MTCDETKQVNNDKQYTSVTCTSLRHVVTSDVQDYYFLERSWVDSSLFMLDFLCDDVSELTSRFSGLTSRWTMRRLWRYFRAWTRLLIMLLASLSVYLVDRAMSSNRSPPCKTHTYQTRTNMYKQFYGQSNNRSILSGNEFAILNTVFYLQYKGKTSHCNITYIHQDKTRNNFSTGTYCGII